MKVWQADMAVGRGQLAEADAYFPPFERICDAISGTKNIDEQDEVVVSGRFLKFLLTTLVADMPFDEAFYKATYPDVVAGIANGSVRSAREHFISRGYFEGRRACRYAVDRAWYLGNYPDLAAAYARGKLSDLDRHFDETGQYEGRSRSADQHAAQVRWDEELSACAEKRASGVRKNKAA
ncbi:hypothetical protein [Mangrovicella endophytica]|uniref:hypothetical protein n=1 Tax=Mangrovicella endophytica TaxID=2066697 RepID=UPI000C9DD3BA|nr:hypothetical protein [Mangrovicella endophytica]